MTQTNSNLLILKLYQNSPDITNEHQHGNPSVSPYQVGPNLVKYSFRPNPVSYIENELKGPGRGPLLDSIV